MSYIKSVRSGAEGNTSLLKSYGGGSTGPRQGYATGGAVGLNKDGPAMSEGLSAAGTPAKPSLARPGRKIAGKKKDAKTNINVIVAGAPPKEAPMPPMGGPPPGPPMPPPGAGPGGPPMPMRASGGRVGYKVGGRVKKREDGGPVTDSESQAARKRGDSAASTAGTEAMLSAANVGNRALWNSIPGRAGKIFRPLSTGLAATFGGAAARNSGRAASERENADRLEKEGRKSGGKVGYKIGGKVKKRADGGSTLSRDSEREAERIEGKRKLDQVGSGGLTGAGLGTLAGLGSSISRAGRVGRMIGAGMTGAGALISAKTLPENDEDREAKRIRAGRPEPGKEDRKHGGKVCRAEGGPVGGLSNDDGGAGGASGRLAKVRMYGK